MSWRLRKMPALINGLFLLFGKPASGHIGPVGDHSLLTGGG
jgi:hypothetical protein